MTFDPVEALKTTLQREEAGLDIFREYRAISEDIDRVHTQRNGELTKLLTLAREHIEALISGPVHVQWAEHPDTLCLICLRPWPCHSSLAQEFLDRLDLDAL